MSQGWFLLGWQVPPPPVTLPGSSLRVCVLISSQQDASGLRVCLSDLISPRIRVSDLVLLWTCHVGAVRTV